MEQSDINSRSYFPLTNAHRVENYTYVVMPCCTVLQVWELSVL